jgi:hypothetical protein
MKRSLLSTSATIPDAQMLLRTYWATSKRSVLAPQFAKITRRRSRIETWFGQISVDAKEAGRAPHGYQSESDSQPLLTGCLGRRRHHTLVSSWLLPRHSFRLLSRVLPHRLPSYLWLHTNLAITLGRRPSFPSSNEFSFPGSRSVSSSVC